jgi:ADP-ribose pyrophosphatase YjhB (NUDIX family)
MLTESRDDKGGDVADVVPIWLKWAREIQALSQTSLHYAENEYQRERNRRLSDIAAEMVSAHTSLPLEPLQNVFRSQTGYATPRVDVRGAVFREGRLLLVRERLDGQWTMPGGWADVGDVPSAAAEREVLEEAGFRVRARKVVGVYDANRITPLELFHAFKIVFLCDLIDGEPRPSKETSEVAFFTMADIPSMLSGERTKLHHVRAAFAALADPMLPTEFD